MQQLRKPGNHLESQIAGRNETNTHQVKRSSGREDGLESRLLSKLRQIHRECACR